MIFVGAPGGHRKFVGGGTCPQAPRSYAPAVQLRNIQMHLRTFKTFFDAFEICEDFTKLRKVQKKISDKVIFKKSANHQLHSRSDDDSIAIY